MMCVLWFIFMQTMIPCVRLDDYIDKSLTWYLQGGYWEAKANGSWAAHRLTDIYDVTK